MKLTKEIQFNKHCSKPDKNIIITIYSISYTVYLTDVMITYTVPDRRNLIAL